MGQYSSKWNLALFICPRFVCSSRPPWSEASEVNARKCAFGNIVSQPVDTSTLSIEAHESGAFTLIGPCRWMSWSSSVATVLLKRPAQDALFLSASLSMRLKSPQIAYIWPGAVVPDRLQLEEADLVAVFQVQHVLGVGCLHQCMHALPAVLHTVV